VHFPSQINEALQSLIHVEMVWGAPRGVDDIVARLQANEPALDALYLMRNRRFEEAEAAALCEALTFNTVLTDLNISSHAVSPAMAKSFAAAIAANSTLQSLSLGNASFGDEVGDTPSFVKYLRNDECSLSPSSLQ